MPLPPYTRLQALSFLPLLPRIANHSFAPLSQPLLALPHSRPLSTCQTLRNAPRIEPPLDIQGGRGSEGVHFKDASTAKIPPQSRRAQDFSTAKGEVKTDKKHDGPPSAEPTGDWVLFHPVYTPEEMKSVQVAHFQAKTFSDKIAILFVRVLRKSFDIVTRYKHLPPSKIEKTASYPAHPETGLELKEGTLQKKDLNTEEIEGLRKKGYLLSPQQWMTRFVFLETIAGVPGMVAGMVRHLNSLGRMRRDRGWIHTLWEEAENERMHLMTFLAMRKPGPLFRLAVLGAQGVFFNAFLLAYLLSPRMCHRFVGALEEEAILTYTRAIQEIEGGRLPEWDKLPAPGIAIDYWRLPKKATFLDVIYAIRADEATHRFVNHTLASLKHNEDFNPFAIRNVDSVTQVSVPGWTREEAREWVEKSRDAIKVGEEGTGTQTQTQTQTQMQMQTQAEMGKEKS